MRLSDSQLEKQLYSRYFLKTMKIKMQEKAKRFPGNIDLLRINHVKSLREFDDLYTAPMHGYKNALDYWTRAPSKPQLKTITVPTLLLNARNDPFIPEPSLPGSQDCRSEEHTSELQSLMRISYAVFCLKKKTQTKPRY